MDKEEIIGIAVKGAKLIKEEAAKYPETNFQFEYSPESFTGTEMDYALEICEAVMDVWQPTSENKMIINLPSTVEMTTPNRYADQIEWFSKNNRSLKSNEFRWLLDGTERPLTWQDRHFVPIFIRRKAEEKETSYYFVGNAASLHDVRESVNVGEDGKESKVVISTLKLMKPVDPELYRHLTGKSAL